MAWPQSSEVEGAVFQFGLYHYERRTGAGLATGMSDDRELRPQLEDVGFSIEDGPGIVAPGGVLQRTVVFDPPAIAADGSTFTDVTVTGAKVDDAVIVNFAAQLGLPVMIDGAVISDNTVRVMFRNVNVVFLQILPSDNLIVTVLTQTSAAVNEYKLNQNGASYYFTAWY